MRRSLTPAGPGNKWVREFFSVKRNGASSGTAAVALEGLWMIRAARAAGCVIEAVFVCADLLRGPDSLRLVGELVEDGVPALSVSARVLTRMAGRDGPDGLAAVGRRPAVALGDLVPGPYALCVVLDGCALPGNLGSLVRCADGVGACAVITTNCRVRLHHPLVLKASMGTVFSVPLCGAEPNEALSWLRLHGFHLLAAEPSSPVSYLNADYPPKVAILLGSERDGLNAFWRAAADERVSIPMLGRADSLNVGHAGAVLLYNALARHGAQQDPPPEARSRRMRATTRRSDRLRRMEL